MDLDLIWIIIVSILLILLVYVQIHPELSLTSEDDFSLKIRQQMASGHYSKHTSFSLIVCLHFLCKLNFLQVEVCKSSRCCEWSEIDCLGFSWALSRTLLRFVNVRNQLFIPSGRTIRTILKCAKCVVRCPNRTAVLIAQFYYLHVVWILHPSMEILKIGLNKWQLILEMKIVSFWW